MKNKLSYIFLIPAMISCGAQQQYTVASINGERIPVFIANHPDTVMSATVNIYKNELDKVMSPVIGKSAQDMPYAAPESLLTNLTSDVMMMLDESEAGGKIDLTLMNVHGHRAPLKKGDITIGDMYEIYSFDNILTVLQLKGSDLMEIFRSYAAIGGAGISSNVRLSIEGDRLSDAKIDGKPVDNEKLYTIVTIDYLADGNDGMDALKNAVSCKRLNILLREYMMEYVKKQAEKGLEITSELDGRIIVL